jgi:outer membrane protein
MKVRFALLALAAVSLVPAAWAQTGSARSAAEPAPTKVAILNIQVAITSTGDGKQASAELQTQFAPRQQEIENMSRQIDDVRNRLRNGATTLSDDEKARLARQGDQLTRTLQRKQQELQDDANEAQREVFDRIGRKMIEVIDNYSKTNGYAVVIDNSTQNSGVVYAATQVDITQDIIRLYDQANPVKATSTAEKPTTTSRPATQKPAPKTPSNP